MFLAFVEFSVHIYACNYINEDKSNMRNAWIKEACSGTFDMFSLKRLFLVKHL